MLITRVNKEPPDITRVIVDMSWWLDTHEIVTKIVSSEVITGMSGWSESPYPPPGSPPPYDPTPLLLLSSTMDVTNRQLIIFVEFGTSGVAYTLQFILDGSSSRRITFEVGVQLTGVPPEQPMPLPPPPSGAAGQEPGARYLNILGGMMEGELYLFHDPLYPTEAATKAYVDSVVGSGGGGPSGDFLPLTGGALTGPLFLPSALPTINTQAAHKLYVDQRDAYLQGQISVLAEDLLFVGQCHVVTDVTLFTAASGITPSPGPLPAAQAHYKGYYVIVVDTGRPPAGSHIPADDYTLHDWLICDGSAWVHLKLGLVYFTASQVAVIPAIQGNTDVQSALTWLSTNSMRSWNARTGAVTMTLADVTGVGGAPVASPLFTGTPRAPTASPGTSTTQLATTAFVMGQVASATTGVSSWNGRAGNVTLATLDITTAGGAPLASPIFTGDPRAPTPLVTDNDTSIATTAFVHNSLLGLGSSYLPLSGGTLTGLLQLPLTLPTLDQHAVNKLYVDQRDAVIQGEISVLAQDLLFIGQCHVVTDSTLFTDASGITPSPGPLPAAVPGYKGYYVIVVDNGRPPGVSHIPADDYTLHDWLICDGSAWVHLKLGLKFFTAAEIEVIPAIQGTTDVQSALTWLSVNKLNKAGDTMTGPLLLAADPANPMGAATKQYVDANTGSVAGVYLPIAGGSMTGPLLLSGDPSNNLGAATKQYVDAKTGTGSAAYLPLTGGTLAGPGNLTVSGGLTANQNLTVTGDAAVGQILTVRGTNNYPQLQLFNSANAADQKRVVMYSDPTGSLNMQFNSDSGLAASTFFSVARGSGYTITSMTLTAPGINLTGTNINLNGAAWVSGTLSGNGIYSNAGFSLNNSGGGLTYDNNYCYYTQDSSRWQWRYTRANGTMSYVRGSDFLALFTIDGGGSLSNTGSMSVGNALSVVNGVSAASLQISGETNTNSIMNRSGAFYVASNYSYYLGRGGDGVWSFVENGTATCSVDASGSLSAKNVISAGTNVHARGGLYASDDNMVFGPGGITRFIQFQSGWYWDWNGGNGDLTWMGGGSHWVETRAYDGYWANYRAGMTGAGPYYDFSDERAKEDVEFTTVGLPEILRVNPIRFTRVTYPVPEQEAEPKLKQLTHTPEIGFGARQLRDIIPEAVRIVGFPLPDGTGGFDDADPTLGVTLGPIVAALVNAVKDLQAQINNLGGTHV